MSTQLRSSRIDPEALLEVIDVRNNGAGCAFLDRGLARAVWTISDMNSELDCSGDEASAAS